MHYNFRFGIIMVYTRLDLDVIPGNTYTADQAEPHLEIMNKYMSFAEASYHFLRFKDGFTCGQACEFPEVKNTVLNATWHNPIPTSDGYLAVNTKSREIYVVWSGTRRIRSIFFDSMFVFEDFPKDIPGSKVHAGFLEMTKSVYPYILKNIRSVSRDYPDFNIVFIGHSLGGANAALAALEYARDTSYDVDRIRVWTFGQPRIGNREFSKYYTTILGNQTYRVTYQADIVPHIPPWQVLGYQHHPLEIHIINKEGDFYVCQNTVREDLDGAYRWPTIDTGVADHIDYFGKPEIANLSPILQW